eukprot:1136894-Pelagomonas_calceolata.AAC.4
MDEVDRHLGCSKQVWTNEADNNLGAAGRYEGMKQTGAGRSKQELRRSAWGPRMKQVGTRVAAGTVKGGNGQALEIHKTGAKGWST